MEQLRQYGQGEPSSTLENGKIRDDCGQGRGEGKGEGGATTKRKGKNSITTIEIWTSAYVLEYIREHLKNKTNKPQQQQQKTQKEAKV